MRFTIVIFLLLFIVACGVPVDTVTQRFMTEEDVSYLENDPDEGQNKNIAGNCFGNDAYIPDTNHLELYPVRQIRVNFHYVNSSDSSKNYYGQEAIDFTKGLLVSANKDLRLNNKLWFPYKNDIPVIPPRLEYRLTPGTDAPNDDGIYFHFDDELCYYIHRGRNRNLYDRTIFEKYGVDTDSTMNVFIMPHHPDSVISKTYSAGTVGVALGKHVKMAGMFEDRGPSWKYRGVLNHEVGHVFGLIHAWTRNDGCDDTPPHPSNCWNKSDVPPCDTMATNNMMDYNALQNALTPCQIGRMHRSIASEKGHTRALVINNWCELENNTPVVIRKNTEWNGEKDINRHLIIDEGIHLKINCRVSMAANATITLRPGAELILNDNARLHNACEKKWQGIIVQRRGTVQGKVTLIGNANIENTSEAVNNPKTR